MLTKSVCWCTLSRSCCRPHLKPLLHGDSFPGYWLHTNSFISWCQRAQQGNKMGWSILICGSPGHAARFLVICCRKRHVSCLRFWWSTSSIFGSCALLPFLPLPTTKRFEEGGFAWGSVGFFVCFSVCVWRWLQCFGVWSRSKPTQAQKSPEISGAHEYSWDVIFGWLVLSLGQFCRVLFLKKSNRDSSHSSLLDVVQYKVTRLPLVLFLNLCWFSN